MIVFFYFSEPAERTVVESIDSSNVPLLAKDTNNDCPACKNKLPFPRTCAVLKCKAGIHHMKECSHPLNENAADEGYNQERICRSCHLKKSAGKTSGRKKQPAGIVCKLTFRTKKTLKSTFTI